MEKINTNVAMSLLLVIFLMTLVYTNPFYIASILVFIILNMIILKKIKELKITLKYSLFTAILIIIINPLVSNAGRTIIYKSAILPFVGKIKITLEALAFGTNMALKLISIFFIFTLYSVLTDRDNSFSFLSKYAHKLTLILSMTTNTIHRLRLEINRVKDVMMLRGVKFNEKNIVKKIKSYYPILKVVLISSLEGSLDRAEALYSRSYGKHKRTSYTDLKMKTVDHIVILINIVLAGLFIYSLVKGIGTYKFYPTFNQFKFVDLRYLLFIDVVLSLYLFLIWGCKKWKFLKYRI